MRHQASVFWSSSVLFCAPALSTGIFIYREIEQVVRWFACEAESK